MTLVKGFSVLLAAIVLPSGTEFDTEEVVIAALEFSFRVIGAQAFFANIVRMGQFLFVFRAGFVVAVKQLTHLRASF